MGAEDAQMVVEGMAQAGVEPTYCMGDDIPLAVLSDKPHMLFNYFKQRFAQVGVRNVHLRVKSLAELLWMHMLWSCLIGDV